MKVTLVIILLVVVKTQASFFDRFKGAMTSIENAFENLFNDVVTNVKTSVHCTIFAVEKALAINGIVQEPLPKKECIKDGSSDNLEMTQANRNSYSAKNIADEINSSISRVNKTLSHVLDNNTHERLEHVKRTLKNESDRLNEVSFLLRRELEKISETMKNEFEKIQLSEKSSLESVWNNMKLLYEVEKNDKNTSKEIGEVLNEALDVLHVNLNKEVNSDEEKIRAIMRELERESNNKKKSKNKIYRKLSQSKLIPEKTRSSFKDVYINSIRNAKERVEVVKDVADKSNSFVNKPSATNEKDESKSPSRNSDDLSFLDNTNSEDNTKAINEAINMMKNNAKTQALLENFFAKEHGVNAFENPDLFNFDK